LLLLFDIDGTLVRGRPLTHQLALERAATEVFGLEVPEASSPVADVEPWGKTDRQILREVLRRARLPTPGEPEIARWEQLACGAYMQLEAEHETSHELTATAAALERLRASGHALALVTGNLEPIARRKLALRGLGEYFPPGEGGFGSDAELRPELVPIARARAGADGRPHPNDDTVLIGDTPLDVSAATADAVRCIAITGTRFSAHDLREAGAAATIDHIPELEDALGELAPL
jgi:phosphoglycolate phosphatase-like HAD superfamily hydrolase